MKWNVPGTTLVTWRSTADSIPNRLESMFLGGGLTLSQVTSITGLDPYMVQNWVKRGFLAKPEQKRYSLNQLCRIITINMLKGILPMDRICEMLRYINGQLDDESDDLIDDARLYFLFLRVAAQARELDSVDQWRDAIEAALADYKEPAPGARDRVAQVLRIMLTAWVAARMAQEAENMLAALEEKEA